MYFCVFRPLYRLCVSAVRAFGRQVFDLVCVGWVVYICMCIYIVYVCFWLIELLLSWAYIQAFKVFLVYVCVLGEGGVNLSGVVD